MKSIAHDDGVLEQAVRAHGGDFHMAQPPKTEMLLGLPGPTESQLSRTTPAHFLTPEKYIVRSRSSNLFGGEFI